MVCLFCVVNILPKILRITFRFQFIKYNQNCRNLNKILDIFSNIESTKKADHILEMSILGVFCKYRLLKLGLRINSAYYFKDQFVLLLSCFVGHPVLTQIHCLFVVRPSRVNHNGWDLKDDLKLVRNDCLRIEYKLVRYMFYNFWIKPKYIYIII